MHLKDFAKSGNPKTLFSAFLYFDISFMIWVMLGPLGNSIGDQFHLTASQKGLMTGLPVLSGSLLRLVLGPLADRIGGRNTALLGLSLTFVPLLLGGLAANSYEVVLLIGLLLGIAGASFAVALPLASGWYPPEQQGLVLGIAGAGNSGTVLASLFCPASGGALRQLAAGFIARHDPCRRCLAGRGAAGERRTRQACRQNAQGICCHLPASRYAVVQPVLQRNLRRLCGAFDLPANSLPRSIWPG
jgi:nitrate/nitrite transporter NarK